VDIGRRKRGSLRENNKGGKREIYLVSKRMATNHRKTIKSEMIERSRQITEERREGLLLRRERKNF